MIPFEKFLEIIPSLTAEDFKPLTGYVYCNPRTGSFQILCPSYSKWRKRKGILIKICKIGVWEHLSQRRFYSRMTSTCIHVICIADIWDIVIENGRWVSSLGVVTRLLADNLGIVGWFPTRRIFFFLLLRSGQTSAVAHPITMAFSPGGYSPTTPTYEYIFMACAWRRRAYVHLLLWCS